MTLKASESQLEKKTKIYFFNATDLGLPNALLNLTR